MIRQVELGAVMDVRGRVAELRETPQVREFLALEKREADQLAALKKRLEESREAGLYKLSIKTSTTVDWQKVLVLFIARPEIALALASDPGAQKLLEQAGNGDLSARYVSERVTLNVIES